MRSFTAALACSLLSSAPSLASADTPAKGPSWPDKGVCIARWPSKSGCIQLGMDDAKAIQRAIVGYLDDAQLEQRPDYRPAKVLVQRPIHDGAIGAFMLLGYEYVGFDGDVLEAIAVESHQSGTERGFKVTLGLAPKGWRVLHFDHYTQKDPRPN